MAKAKTTTKKRTSKSTVGGSALKNNKSLNWKIIIPIIVLIALVGGFQVFRSRAAAGHTFDIDPGQFQNSETSKINGVNYGIVKPGGSVKAIISKAQASASNNICASYKILVPFTGAANYKIRLTQSSVSERSVNSVPSSGEMCLNTKPSAEIGTLTINVSANNMPMMGVSNVYGVR